MKKKLNSTTKYLNNHNPLYIHIYIYIIYIIYKREWKLSALAYLFWIYFIFIFKIHGVFVGYIFNHFFYQCCQKSGCKWSTIFFKISRFLKSLSISIIIYLIKNDTNTRLAHMRQKKVSLTTDNNGSAHVDLWNKCMITKSVNTKWTQQMQSLIQPK